MWAQYVLRKDAANRSTGYPQTGSRGSDAEAMGGWRDHPSLWLLRGGVSELHLMEQVCPRARPRVQGAGADAFCVRASFCVVTQPTCVLLCAEWLHAQIRAARSNS